MRSESEREKSEKRSGVLELEECFGEHRRLEELEFGVQRAEKREKCERVRARIRCLLEALTRANADRVQTDIDNLDARIALTHAGRRRGGTEGERAKEKCEGDIESEIKSVECRVPVSRARLLCWRGLSGLLSPLSPLSSLVCVSA